MYNKIKTDYEDVVELYNSGKTTKEIALIKGVDRENIAKHLFRVKKIKPRRSGYPINETFFECIDNEIKAYLLGFFYADGCICKNSLQVLIQADDIEVLKMFRDNLSPTKPIQEYEYKSDGVNRKKQAKFKVNSDKFIADLKKLGYEERKTNKEFSMKFVPKDLKRHFIRGFVDGDGCYSIRKDKRGVYAKRITTICMSKNFITEINDYFLSLGIRSTIFTSQTKKGLQLFGNNISNLEGCQKLYTELYSNANFFLKRKQIKAFYCTLTPRELDELKIF